MSSSPRLVGPLSQPHTLEFLPWNWPRSSFLPFGALLGPSPHMWSQCPPKLQDSYLWGSEVPVLGTWPGRSCWMRKGCSLHKWTALLSPPMGPLPGFSYALWAAGCHQHRKRSHARHAVIMSSGVRKKSPLEDGLVVLGQYRRNPNGRFSMSRKWIITPVLLHTLGRVVLWSPSMKHTLWIIGNQYSQAEWRMTLCRNQS